MSNVYTTDTFHVCVLPEANRKWQVGQVYSCDCNRLFRVIAYYEGKGFVYIGKLNDTRKSN